MHPAINLLEFDSIAVGIAAGDAMAKRAPLATLHAGTVHPGKYLVLAGGEVACVEEARLAGIEVGADSLLDEIYLPEVHSEVVRALTGYRQANDHSAIGVLEVTTVAATIGAADAGIKGAEVSLLEVRLADGLGGKGYVLFGGELSNIEAAMEAGELSLASANLKVGAVVIPQIHHEMSENLLAHSEFAARINPGRYK
ncbi:MAG: BMC domain-containing protein [Thermoanaerobaculia bacterium]